MNDYFILEFDTTPPDVFIDSFDSTVWNAVYVVTIIPTADFDPSYQEIYIIDGEGTRHDLTFAVEGNTLVGTFTLIGFPRGEIINLYVCLRDTVWNYAPVVNKQITVIYDAIGLVTISNKSRKILTLARDEW